MSAPYQTIKTTIMAKVRAGEWRPGDRVPGEEALAEDFGCARATVHRALRELAEEGVLERKRKAGTRVAQRGHQDLSLSIPLVEEEIRSTGARYDYRLLSSQQLPVPALVAPRLGLSVGQTAVHIRCLHFADHRPFQVEDRWINLETVPEAKETSFAEIGPNAWLVAQIPWTEAEHEIYADEAPEEIAEALDLCSGAPVLILERRTRNASGIVTTARFYYPGKSFRLKAGF